jgi:hypothetical protein
MQYLHASSLKQTLCEDPTLIVIPACHVISKEFISGLGIKNIFFKFYGKMQVL